MPIRAHSPASHRPTPLPSGKWSLPTIRTSLPFLAIALVGLLSYANALDGDFLWDDLNFVKRNFLIRDWSHLPKVFMSDPGQSSGVWYGFYRPLQTVSYMVNYALGGYNVVGYHAVNILFHLLASLALCRFASLLSGEPFIGLATGLLYVGNPLHVEAVAYVSGRADSMALLFMLLSLICYLKLGTGAGARNFPLAVLFFALALLSKENSAVLPAVMLLYDFAFRRRVRWRVYGAVAAVLALYIVLRLTLLSPIVSHAQATSSVLERVPGFFAAIAGYVRLLLVPLNLHPAYGEGVFSFTDPPVLTGVALVLLLAAAAWFLRRRNRLLFFALCWFFITLLPVSNLYAVVYYMADHYLYVPSIGFFLAVGQGLNALRRTSSRAGLAGLALLTAGSGLLTTRQNELWQEPVAFFETTIERGGSSYQLYLHLGDLYRDNKHYEKALVLYRKALEKKADDSISYANTGQTYNLLGNYSQGAWFFDYAIKLNPKVPQFYNNRGYSYERLALTEKAAEDFRKAISLNPYDATYYLNLAGIYYREGRLKDAQAVLDAAVSSVGSDPRVHAWLAEIAARKSDAPRSRRSNDSAAGITGR